jgi:hypothetical protein
VRMKVTTPPANRANSTSTTMPMTRSPGLAVAR